MAIHFYYQIENFRLQDEDRTAKWIRSVLKNQGYQDRAIQYIFMSDEELIKINMAYLNHDYYTDIITFPLGYTDKGIDSDIYISIDRVKDNATHYKTGFKEELDRVIIHGILHLCGYNDHSEEERKLMRKLEKEALEMQEV